MQRVGNPVLDGWWADPELHFFRGRYWLYPTDSRAYDEQTRFYAFSSEDLTDWRPEGVILDFADVPWSTNRCAWAPSCIERDGRFYFYFSAGDGAGLGVAVADDPGGPFVDALGRPLVAEYHHGAQPIDAHAFLDDDGQAYLYWGGWRKAVVSRLGADMISLEGEILDITPDHYVEGPFMAKRNGRFLFMWSEGSWGDATYQIAYAHSESPLGPFVREAAIFVPSPDIATSAGHHSVLQLPDGDRWVVAYHRRPLDETSRDHRVVCLEEMTFNAEGSIQPIPLTHVGVAPAGGSGKTGTVASDDAKVP